MSRGLSGHSRLYRSGRRNHLLRPIRGLSSTTGTTGSFGYTGAASDVGGLVNLQAREYNPAYGQFLQADSYTVGGPGTAGYNHYTYTGDNPVTRVDPSGHIGEGGLTGEAVEESVEESEQDIAEQSGRQALAAAYSQFARAMGQLVVRRLTECAESVAEGVALDATTRAVGTTIGAAAGGASTGGALGAGAAAAVDPGELAGDALNGTLDCVEEPSAPVPSLPSGYPSFSAAKRAIGSPGGGNVFDHVVEQSQAGRSGFSLYDINNPFNMNPVPANVNQLKANYYSTKQVFTNGATIRDWLTGMSFEDQYEFGMEILRRIVNGIPL